MAIDWARVGAAVATGGGSEVLRGATNYLEDTTKAPGAAGDTAAARAERGKLLQQYDNPTTRPAPQAQPGQVTQVAKADPTIVTPAAQTRTPLIMPATQAQAGQVAPVAGVAAPRVQAAQPVDAALAGSSRIGNIERYGASQIAPTVAATAAPVKAETANAATLDTSQEGQLRAHQLAILGQLEGAAAGTGPSAAQEQFQRNLDESIAAQRAQVAGNRGTGSVTANLNAATNIANLTSAGARDAAALRAQEQNQARAQLVQALEGTRGQDIGVATTQAGFQQGANLQNAQLGTQANIAGAQMQTDVSKLNAEQANARSMKQADLEQAAAAGNATAQNEMARRQAELDQAANLANQQARMQASLANQGVQQQANMTQAELQSKSDLANQATALAQGTTNAQLTTQTNLSNADAENRLAVLRAQIEAQGGQFNAEQANEMSKLQAQLNQSTSTFNAAQQNQISQTNAQLQNQTNLANLDSTLRQEGLDDATRARILDAYVAMTGQVLGADQAETQRRTQIAGTVLKTSGDTIATGLKSDRRVKKDIKPLYSDERGKILDHLDGGKGELEEMLIKLHPVAFKYKNPDADGAAPGQRYGILAQDLEKSPVGRSLVHEEGGVKKIDVGQAVGVLLAAMSRMNKKLSKKAA